MNVVADFFKRLLGVHLFFWETNFVRFDALVLFGGICTALGMTEYLTQNKIDGVSLSMILQFLAYIFAFLFCYIWKPFRNELADIAGNMVCVSLCISVLAGLLAFALKFAIIVPPLDQTVGLLIVRSINYIRNSFSWNSHLILSGILFLLAYFCIFLNTVHIFGRSALSIFVHNFIPVAVSAVISLVACSLVLWPILIALEY